MLRKLLIVILAFMLMALAVGRTVNSRWVLDHSLSIINSRSDWKLSIGKFRWDILGSKITISDFKSSNENKGKEADLTDVTISYRPLGIIRGKLLIECLNASGAVLFLPTKPRQTESTGHKLMNLAKLVLLKNLEIKNARIEKLFASFGAGSSLTIDSADFSINPALLGDTKVSLSANNAKYLKDGLKITSAETTNVRVSTELSRWTSYFPYLNSIKGDLEIKGFWGSGLSAEDIKANLGYTDSVIELSDLKISMEGKTLAGHLKANKDSEQFDLTVDIPKPIYLPHFGKELQTVETEGEVWGQIKLSGNGFEFSNTKGKGHLEIAYRFRVSPDAPVSMSSDLEWVNGLLTLKNTSAKAGNDPFSVEGTIDFAHKQIKLASHGKNFPVEHVFEKFKNPHLKKIFGPADFSGTFEGWGKKFVAKVDGTVQNGGWQPITAEVTECNLEATYDELNLRGKIFSGGKETGQSNLSIKFGPKIGDLDRKKDITFDAWVSNHPLASSLASFGLLGQGTGKIKLSGPHTAFKGEATAEITDGSWHGLPFKRAETKIALSRHQIVFSDMAVELEKISAPQISGNLVGDIDPDKFRLHGTPIAGLTVDTTYRHSDKRWIISDISWRDPSSETILTTKGDIISGGGIDLKIKGTAEISLFSLLTTAIKEAQGFSDIDLSIKGSAADPKILGKVAFKKAAVSPRGTRLDLEDISGEIKFEGSRIRLDGISAKVDDGLLTVSGYLDQKNLAVKNMDLTLRGQSMRYRSDDGAFNLELDGELTVAGNYPSPLIKGTVTILDGKYTKDFTIIDVITGSSPIRTTEKKNESDFDPHLDLTVRSSGDLEIKNNVGEIWLNVDVNVRGTKKKPLVSGAIETVEGTVHYLGLGFDITKGFIEFRDRYSKPYMEVYAQKEVTLYSVNLLLHGPIDNLALDLSATSPTGSLEKRDVVSLLLFGATSAERTRTSQNAGSNVSASIAGQAIGGVIAMPVQKFTHLDTFRLETSDTSSSGISRIYFGKQISDRISVNFATDINSQAAVQTVIGEYMVTDNLLISGSRSTNSDYTFGGLLRFRLR